MVTLSSTQKFSRDPIGHQHGWKELYAWFLQIMPIALSTYKYWVHLVLWANLDLSKLYVSNILHGSGCTEVQDKFNYEPE